MNKTVNANILHLLLPGSGYLYLKMKRRLWIAIPLVVWSLYQIGFVCFVFLTGSHYSYSENLLPFTGSGMSNINLYSWLILFVVSVDTAVEGKKLEQDHT